MRNEHQYQDDRGNGCLATNQIHLRYIIDGEQIEKVISHAHPGS